MNSMNKIASAIAKREGKKSQARIGDIREILRILCELQAEEVASESLVSTGGRDDFTFDILEARVDRIYPRVRKKIQKELGKDK